MITERHIRNLDNMVAHGINLIGVYIQGSNAGWPDADAALNGFTPDGKLKPVVLRMIQKQMPIPETGFVVNVETSRQDVYQNDGVFNQTNLDSIFADCARYQAAPNAAMLFHAAFIQGITNDSGSAPHAEMGGYGTGGNDRGVRFYYEWVRDQVGRWGYPRHVRGK